MLVLALNSLVKEIAKRCKKGVEPNTITSTLCKVSRSRHLAANGLTPEKKQEKMKKVLDNGFLLWDNK
jgi:hypothetical protein|tara:strand:+ start:262 stop:465 length:204 start_codon:yes stop_codon:yes gene_type:complete